MIVALTLILAVSAHAGVVRAPVELGGLPLSAAAISGAPAAALTGASLTGSPMPLLPSYLSVANPADALKLSAVLQAAQASPTAMKVLAQVERFAAARGRPVVIEVSRMKDGGSYSLDSGILSLRRRDIEKDTPRANVALIIHELQHLLQTKHDLPSDLLETEVESYLVDFRVVRELGDVARPGSPDAKLQAKFKEGFAPFMDYLGKRYSEDSPLYKTKSLDYTHRLMRGLDKTSAKLGRVQQERDARARVLKQMSRLGHPEHELRNYRQDEIAPLDVQIATLWREIRWAQSDIVLMLNPERVAKARAYSRSVIRRARAFQKIFARD